MVTSGQDLTQLKNSLGLGVVVAHTFTFQNSEGRGRRISKFKATRVYRESSRTARLKQLRKPWRTESW